MELAPAVAAQRDQDHRRGRRAFLPRVLHRQPVERAEEAVHEGGIRLDRLLAGGAPQVGGAQEVDVGGEVLPQELEAETSSSLRPLRRCALESPLGLGLDAAELTEQFR